MKISQVQNNNYNKKQNPKFCALKTSNWGCMVLNDKIRIATINFNEEASKYGIKTGFYQKHKNDLFKFVLTKFGSPEEKELIQKYPLVRAVAVPDEEAAECIKLFEDRCSKKI